MLWEERALLLLLIELLLRMLLLLPMVAFERRAGPFAMATSVGSVLKVQHETCTPPLEGKGGLGSKEGKGNEGGQGKGGRW